MVVTYRSSGVDIARADRLLHRLKPTIRATHGAQVLPDAGQFAGLFRLGGLGLRDPVLVASADGAGTKLRLAQLIGRHTSIGVDVVAMNVNELIVYGAKPLFFLDYIAMGKLAPAVYGQLLRGMAKGCRQAECALLGGETAEMPGLYAAGEYDVAGFCVGVVERRRIVDGSQVRAGDAVVGVASSGVHANGFSLVRSVFTEAQLRRRAASLLRPTRIYVAPVLEAVRRGLVTGLAHVTGGGLARRLPSLVGRRRALRVVWRKKAWPMPRIFAQIQAAGSVATDEMYRTFNMGIGMAAACRASSAVRLIKLYASFGYSAWVIGSIERSSSEAIG